MHLTIYTIAYNEEYFLPFFIQHYRARFPTCRIVVYDNESTDTTADIARAAGCEVITYSTNNTLSDATYLQIKNNCWKNTFGWVLIADVDELCDISTKDLLYEARKGHTILTFEGYNMVNLTDAHANPNKIYTGIRAPSYDKAYCFNAILVKDINYGPGCHHAAPTGTVRYSTRRYHCRHFKYLHPDYMVKRHALFASRLSADNLAKGYGGHYLYTPQQIHAEFAEARQQAKRVIF